MAKIDRDKLCADFEACIGWPYVSPGSNDERGIDCSGMFVRAYKRQGASIYHGSNTIWRKHMGQNKFRLTSASQLRKGMAVFKWKEAGDPQKDGQGNFCHIGLVTQVNPLRIVHASTTGMVVRVDSKIGKWAYAGELAEVNDGGQASTVASVETVADGAIYPTLKRGARGADVRVLQQALSGAGFILEVDGVFGLATRTAVVAYQRQHGLTADGIVGEKTWAALRGGV